MANISYPLQKSLIRLINGYRYFISPLLGNRCRFYPSCSQYAQDALQHCGIVRGLGLTAWRLLRCQPFHPGGYDPIDKREAK
jgi:putative membrane protein insertion efficiency factor